MRLFAGNSQQFLQDTIQNQIAEKLRLAFFNYLRIFVETETASRSSLSLGGKTDSPRKMTKFALA